MRSFHNIEKSAFVNGEYVAYGRGEVWAVKRAATGWAAFCRMSKFPCVHGRTLADISKLVEG